MKFNKQIREGHWNSSNTQHDNALTPAALPSLDIMRFDFHRCKCLDAAVLHTHQRFIGFPSL